LNEETR
jgi:hypothetical protein